MNQTSFCLICQNSRFDLQEGYLCKFTNKKADFEDECPDFLLNVQKKEEILSPIIKQITDSIESRDTLWNKVKNGKLWYKFLNTENYFNNKPTNYSFYDFYTTPKKKAHILLNGLIFIALVTYIVITEDLNSSNTALLIIIFLFFAGSWFVYQSIKKEKLITIDSKGIVSYKRRFFTKKKNFTRWSDILFVYFQYENKGREMMEFLILKLSNNQEKKIHVNELDQKELGTILLSYLRKYKKN